ncbi:MAG: tripartite tricarboxylate transporter substrate binding protein [Thermodesulfobacteriota bacterium]
MLRKVAFISVALALLACPLAMAADFPAKEVQIIVPWSAGGATDLIFRALANSTEKYLKKPVVVVNRPGGGGAVGYTEGSKARPDGYTLTAAVTPLTILPHNVKTAFTYQNFAPIINVVSDPSMFLVQAKSPWKDLKEFLAYAKQNPNMITVGNSGAGGGVHLVALAFQNAAGVKFNHIPFAGGGPSVTALLGGHINAVVVSPPEGVPHVKAGKLRIIALFAAKRLPLFPDVPTVTEQGVPFVMGMWRGLVAPKGTPPAVIQKLHGAFKKGMEDAAFKKNAKGMGINLDYMNGAAFGKLIADSDAKFSALIKQLKKK